MASLSEYTAAKKRRDSARDHVLELSNKLRRVADLLQNPESVQLNEETEMRFLRPSRYLPDESQIPTWSQIAEALRVFLRAEDEYRSIYSSLPADQRQQLRLD